MLVFKQLFTFFKARCFIAVSQFQNIGNYFHYSNFEIGLQCENHIIEIACLNILQIGNSPFRQGEWPPA